MSYTASDVWNDCIYNEDDLQEDLALESFTKRLSENNNHIKLLHHLLNEIAFKNDSNIYEYMLEISSFHNAEDEESCIIVKRNGCTEIFGNIPKGMKVISSSGKDIDSYEGL